MLVLPSNAPCSYCIYISTSLLKPSAALPASADLPAMDISDDELSAHSLATKRSIKPLPVNNNRRYFNCFIY